MLRLLSSTARWLGLALAAVLQSLVIPLLLLACIIGPVLLKPFGPIAIPPDLLPLRYVISGVLTLIMVTTVYVAAEARLDCRNFDAFALALLLVVVVAVVTTAVFAWQALTDWSYEHRGGVTSCTVSAVDKNVENFQNPMSGGSHEKTTYTYTMDCDVKSVTEWKTSAEQGVGPADHLMLEYDATGRFEIRPFEPHRPWQSSARITLRLFAASSLIYLAGITYAFCAPNRSRVTNRTQDP